MSVKTTSVIRGKLHSLRLMLTLGIVVMLIKLYAFIVTGSNAILSDALESFVNIAASGFALYSVMYSSKLKDSDHPYGHGKMEFVAVGFEGALIFCTGIFIVIKSVMNLFTAHEIVEVDLGIIITAASGVILFLMGKYLNAKAKKLNADVLKAEGKHFIIDSLTTAAIITGLIIYRFTGYYWIDSALAILLSIHIMYSGYKMTKQSMDTLLDRADMNVIHKIATVMQTNRRPAWIDVHNLRVQKFGHYLHIDCHLTLPFYATLQEVHDEVTQVEKILNENFDNKIELFVHTDPCMQKPCNICRVNDPQYRLKEFQKEVEWNAGNMMRNKKHHLD
ncbi:MAG TPA: cation diffusion facilitator family transporter [Bacteroidia bacterium]|nr:cation diffusion facilitator family transporter [Bacteroidia bacterium]